MNRNTIAISALIAVGCSDSTAPGERVPVLGQYAYTMQIPAAYGTPSPRQYTGTLTITFASEDSIAGVWAVAGYQSSPDGGSWNADAYLLYADVPDGFISHRLQPREGGFSCIGFLFLSVGRVDGTCQLQLRK